MALNPYDINPATDCPFCHIAEEHLGTCLDCNSDSVCPTHGCTNTRCEVGSKIVNPSWVLFTKRTEDPKLAWIEGELDKLGIPHRRHGESRDAPILEVPANRELEAEGILMRRVGRYTIDDIRDDHPRWRV
jgi:hypothetical protein